ncbi:hypothetical protein F5144DRAFT_172110 [Chaetomium tenue]|uniref:Uncharacterized protein n=1 Tax=Chaetomium tenue TaxID=1854479 RepID=A0ACB7PAY9_9PEZI|nr:hypothetical protein F5144DRAFT_172110 [Chaetomium globosum]
MSLTPLPVSTTMLSQHAQQGTASQPAGSGLDEQHWPPRRRAPRDPDASFLVSAFATFTRGAHIQAAGRTPVFVFVEISSLLFSQVIRFLTPLFTNRNGKGILRFSLIPYLREPICQLSAQRRTHIRRNTQPRNIGRPDTTVTKTHSLTFFRLRPSPSNHSFRNSRVRSPATLVDRGASFSLHAIIGIVRLLLFRHRPE